jgi:predicted membrane channel-forming protein YqfA (hemolysin III family)
MNKIAKYVTAIFCILVLAYGVWLVIKTTFPIEEWFEQNPSWRTIFYLLIIIGVIGLMAAVVEAHRK